MLADVNYQDFQDSSANRLDEKLLVRFFVKEREDKDESEKEGRPIYAEVEYVEIRVPGKRDALASRPATHKDKMRFAKHYEMFKKRIEAPEIGTPLTQWPRISRSMVEELAFFNVKTVEQLSDMADIHAMKLHGGLNFKREALEFLQDSSKTALIAENEAMKAQLNDQGTKLTAMMERLDAFTRADSMQGELDLTPVKSKKTLNPRPKQK